jgi:hypothetical protein
VAKPPADRVIAALLERHGQTYAQELGIDVAMGTPSVLFWLLVASILFSARIGASQVAKAARALTEVGWATAEKLAAASWQQRVRVLTGTAMPATTSAPRPCWGMPASCCWTATGATCAACAPRPAGTRGRSGGCSCRSRGWGRWAWTFSSGGPGRLGGAVPVRGPAGRPGRPPARSGRRPPGAGRRPGPGPLPDHPHGVPPSAARPTTGAGSVSASLPAGRAPLRLIPSDPRRGSSPPILAGLGLRGDLFDGSTRDHRLRLALDRLAPGVGLLVVHLDQ